MTVTSSEQRLIEATLEILTEKGYRGATTREIADRAGLSEVTLFRKFSSKANLIGAAMAQATEPFRTAAEEVTDDVVGDLAAVAANYIAFVDRWPALVDRVLPELAADAELGALAGGTISENADATRRLVVHHQAGGRLVTVEPDEVVRAFLGPLLARAALRAVLPPGPFDPRAYAERFLDGYRPKPQRPADT